MRYRLKDNDHSDLSDGFENGGPERRFEVEGPERPTNTSYSMMHETSGQLSLLDEGIMESNLRCSEERSMIEIEDNREMG